MIRVFKDQNLANPEPRVFHSTLDAGFFIFLGDLIYSITDLNPYKVCPKNMKNPASKVE